MRNKFENEKEEKRNYDQALTHRFGELNTLINEEKLKYNETIRSLESMKREFYQNIENERTKLNSMISETRDASLLITNDRIDKTKEDLLNRIREVERVSIFF